MPKFMILDIKRYSDLETQLKGEPRSFEVTSFAYGKNGSAGWGDPLGISARNLPRTIVW